MSKIKDRMARKVRGSAAARKHLADEQERATNGQFGSGSGKSKPSKEREDPKSLSNEQPSEEESEELYKPRAGGVESRPWPFPKED